MRDLLASQNAAAALSPLPEPEESIHAAVNSSFHGWSIVPAILSLAGGATITDLHVATLGFNAANARSMMDMIDRGSLARVVFLCSCYFKASSAPEYEMLRNGLRWRGGRIAARRAHAKIIAMRMSDGRAFVVETSANLRSCNNVEQVTLIHSEPLRAFHADWIEKLVCQGDEEPKRNSRPK